MRSDILYHSDKVIPAWLQPVVVLDLCRARGVDPARLLDNTALFLDDLPLRNKQLNLSQYRQLLDNANRLWPGDDFPFQLGHQIADNGLGPLSELLSLCHSTSAKLAALCQFSRLVSPALRLQCYQHDTQSFTILCSAAGHLNLSDPERLSAITTLRCLLKRYAGADHVACYLSAAARHPLYHYYSHLSASCHFKAPWDGIRFSINSPDNLDNSASPLLRYQVVVEECAHLMSSQEYLIAALRTYIARNPESCELPSCAHFLGVSAATLKRRLREHSCSFQQVLDSIHREQALVALLLHGASTEAIAEQLRFHDSSNFRRAFKRWTGTTPSMLKSIFE